MTLKDRARLIRNATPHRLSELFEMQNHICDLCSHPIQALCLADLDHSIPIDYFARSILPLPEAIAQANALQNLRCAHASCNRRKHNKTRAEWFALGLNIVDVPLLLSAARLTEIQKNLSACGRMSGGSAAGRLHMAALGRSGAGSRKAKELGVGIFGLSHEQRVKNSRKSGQRSCETGHIQALGHVQGQKNVESGHLRRISKIRTPASIAASRANGKRNAETGHLHRIARISAFRRFQRQVRGLCSGIL